MGEKCLKISGILTICVANEDSTNSIVLNSNEQINTNRMKKFKTLFSVAIMLFIHLHLHAQAKSSTTLNNKSIANQFYAEVISKGDSSVMKSIMAENFIDHNAAPNLPKGIEGFKQFLTMVVTAFPDIQVKVEDVLADADKVIVRLTVSGTQTGVFMGNIPPSGKHAVWTGIDIIKIENGKITERWSQRDLLGIMKQIGAVK